MLRALWFLLQFIIVALAAIWLIERPGEVSLEAFGYSLTIQTGLFLILFVAAAILLGFAVRLFSAIVSLPGWLGQWGLRRRRAKAMRQLTQGYAQLSAGQAAKALKLSQKIYDVLPEARALVLLLDAQAHRMLGKEASAARAYQQLMRDKDAVFLGLKGLLSQSMEQGHTQQALDYAQKAARLHPKTGWIMRTLYDLQITARDFDAARQSLKKAVKLGVIAKDNAISDEIAMLIYQAEKREEEERGDDALRLLEKAVKLNPAFVPGVVLFAQKLIVRGRARRAQSVVEAAWKTNPHPALIPLWDRLAPQNTSRDMMKRLRWFEKLVSLNPESAHGQMAAAQEAMASNLTGEAQGYLARAEKLAPSPDLYRQMLALERANGAGEARIRAIEEKLAKAPPSPVWTCRKTGMVYEAWSPIARPHGSFNTIEWGLPHVARPIDIAAPRGGLDDPLMIGALARA